MPVSGGSPSASAHPLAALDLSVGGTDIRRQQADVLKREALQLKREGRTTEALQKLREAKAMESGVPPLSFESGMVGGNKMGSRVAGGSAAKVEMDVGLMLAGDEEAEVEVEVGEEDEEDPEMLAALREVGWKEEGLGDTELQGKGRDVQRASGVPVGLGGGRKHGAEGAGRGVGEVDLSAILRGEESEEEVEVEEGDEEDPEIMAALKGVGWEDEGGGKEGRKGVDDEGRGRWRG